MLVLILRLLLKLWNFKARDNKNVGILNGYILKRNGNAVQPAVEYIEKKLPIMQNSNNVFLS